MELTIIALLISLASPLFLLPVEKLLPYPHVIEELLKLMIVFLIYKSVKGTIDLLKWVVIAAVLFTISESIFYLVNVFALGNISLFPQRLLLTGALHFGTFLLLYFSIKKNYLWLAGGVTASILIHYFYNSIIGFNSF